MCVVIALLSVGSRVVCFIQLTGNPVAYQHRWDVSDMNFYDLWAKRLAGGDWLQNCSLHPLHAWHQDMARVHLAKHPDAVDDVPWLEPPGVEPTPEHKLWDKWYGQKRFHQEPLYPYLIAVTYRVLGADPRWVFLWQMLVGCGTNVLIYLLARRMLGEIPGAIAGLLAVGYAPLLYYEIILLREATLVFATVALMYLTSIADERQKWTWWLITGVAMGLSLLLKTTLGVYIVIVLAAIAVRNLRNPRRAVACAFATIAGIFIALAPAIARNVAVGVKPLELSSVGTITFINANAGDLDNNHFGFTWSMRFAPDIMAESNGQLTSAIIPTLKTFRSGDDFLDMMGNKLRWMINWYEIPNNSNFYFYRLNTPVLWWLPISFGLIAPLSLIGMLVGVREMRRLWPLYAMTVANIVVLLLFYISSRMRIPLVPELILFAALALLQLSRWTAQRRWLQLAIALVMMAIGYFAVWQPIPKLRPFIRTEDYAVAYAYYYGPEISKAQKRGDLSAARTKFEDFLRCEPAHLNALDEWHPVKDTNVQLTATLFADAHARYSRLLEQQNQPQAAQWHMNRARALMAAAGKKMPF